MRVGVFFSGGKDSTISAFLMSASGYEVELVGFIPKKKHSYMLHGEALELLELQAEAMGFPLHKIDVSGEKEVEVEEMLRGVESLGLEGIAAGALESEYQRQRVEWIGHELNIPSYRPIWKRESVEELYRRMEIIFVKVAAEGLGKDMLGKSFAPFAGGHRLLEGGEGETAVLDAPFFKKRIRLKKTIKEWYGTWGELKVLDAELQEKPLRNM